MVWMVPWNLFLAALPIPLGLVLARRLEARSGTAVRRVVTLAVAGAWLLLLPNAPYLLTEVRHLLFDSPWRELLHDPVPEARRALIGWGLAFLVYGAAGMAAFTAALRPVEVALRARWPGLRRLRAPFFFVIALGVWLGLIPRWNSWDALLHPLGILGSAFHALSHPVTLALIGAFAMVLCGVHYLLCAAWVGWRASRPAETAAR
jgi:uncharacterized membrane protein